MIKASVNNFDHDHYLALSRNSQQRAKVEKYRYFTGAAFVIISILCVMISLSEHKLDEVAFVTAVFVFAMFIGAVIRLAKTDSAKSFSTMQNENPNYRLTIAFDNEVFYIDSSTDFSERHGKYKYQQLISATEADGFFIISIGKITYAVFNASELTEGTPDELRALLSSKLGAKYRRK